MVFYAAFKSISVISWRQLTLFMSFLGSTSTRLGSEVSCPWILPEKNPEDPVWLEPRTPGLRVKHFTTEPRGTLEFCKQFNIHLLIRSQRPKTTGICKKRPKLMITDQKFYLPGGLPNG